MPGGSVIKKAFEKALLRKSNKENGVNMVKEAADDVFMQGVRRNRIQSEMDKFVNKIMKEEAAEPPKAPVIDEIIEDPDLGGTTTQKRFDDDINSGLNPEIAKLLESQDLFDELPFNVQGGIIENEMSFVDGVIRWTPDGAIVSRADLEPLIKEARRVMFDLRRKPDADVTLGEMTTARERLDQLEEMNEFIGFQMGGREFRAGDTVGFDRPGMQNSPNFSTSEVFSEIVTPARKETGFDDEFWRNAHDPSTSLSEVMKDITDATGLDLQKATPKTFNETVSDRSLLNILIHEAVEADPLAVNTLDILNRPAATSFSRLEFMVANERMLARLGREFEEQTGNKVVMAPQGNSIQFIRFRTEDQQREFLDMLGPIGKDIRDQQFAAPHHEGVRAAGEINTPTNDEQFNRLFFINDLELKISSNLLKLSGDRFNDLL